jgi:hypothetical protein
MVESQFRKSCELSYLIQFHAGWKNGAVHNRELTPKVMLLFGEGQKFAANDRLMSVEYSGKPLTLGN